MSATDMLEAFWCGGYIAAMLLMAVGLWVMVCALINGSLD